MAGVKGRSGGARPGSGPKPKAEKFAPQIDRMEKRLARDLDKRIATISMLAEGGLPIVSEVWEPAGLHQVDAYEAILDENGQPTGKTYRIKAPAFPHLKPDQMVLVKKTVSTLAPNLVANLYLVNRLAGTPTPAIEPEPESGLAGAIPPELDEAVAKIYAAPAPE